MRSYRKKCQRNKKRIQIFCQKYFHEKRNADIDFVNEMTSVLKKYESQTSKYFLPNFLKIKGAVSEAKRGLKKSIYEVKSTSEAKD